MPLRICFVIPSLRRAGAETQLVNLVNGLDLDQVQPYVVVFEHRLEQLQRLDRRKVQVLTMIRRGSFDLAVPRRIARLVDDENIDVVHCSMRWALLMGWTGRLLARRKPPLVATLHSTVQSKGKAVLRDRWIYPWLLRRCARVFFVCEAQHRYWQSRFGFLGLRGRVIHNGVDSSIFDPAEHRRAGAQLRRQLEIAEGIPLVSCLAGFRPEKGHQVLLEAMARAQTHFHLALAGDGELRSLLEAAARRLQLQDRVHFLGEMHDVRTLLAASELTVLASIAVESFSLAMLESMAMGVPVLASDVGGLREAIRNQETGMLVPSGDPAELAAALDHLLAERDHLRQMGTSARALVLARFQAEQMVQRTTAELQAVARGSKGAPR